MNSLSMLYRSFYTRMKIRNSWRRNCSIREQKGGIAEEKYLILTPWARRKTFPDRSVSWLRRNEFLYRVASCFSGWMPSRGHTGTGGNGQSRRQRRRFCAEDGRTDGRWTRALSSLGPVSPSFSIERSQWMPIHWCVVGWFDEAWWMLLESRDSARTERAKSRLKSATRAVRLFPGPVRPTIQTIAAPIVCIGTHCTPLSQSRLSLSLSLDRAGNTGRGTDIAARSARTWIPVNGLVPPTLRNATDIVSWSRGNAPISLVTRGNLIREGGEKF